VGDFTSLLTEAYLRSSRREFLKQAAIVASASCLPGIAQAHAPELSFPTAPRERLAVTSYPFRSVFTKQGMDIKDFPAMMVERFDIHNINPLLNHFRSTDPAYLASFREAVAKAKSHVVDFGLPGRCFATSDASLAATAVHDASQWIDIAAAIGSPSVRQHLAPQAGQTPNLDGAVSSLTRLADYGSKRNVVVNLENDSATWEDPYFILKVLERVNHPYLRALPDFGNSIVVYGEEGNEKAVAALLEHVFNMCHVKGAVQSEAGKTLPVDLGKMFALAKRSGYRGYFSMEFDTNGGDPFTGTQKLIDETLHYLG
jgi:sugar phosphate isomerase/epimerase